MKDTKTEEEKTRKIKQQRGNSFLISVLFEAYVTIIYERNQPCFKVIIALLGMEI